MVDFEIRHRTAVGPRSQRLAWVGFLAALLLATTSAVQAEDAGDRARVDLNRATAEELASLPGIGAAKAAAIVEYRNASGAFGSVDELEAVRGIGPALVKKLRPHVTLGSPRGALSPSAGSKARKGAAR